MKSRFAALFGATFGAVVLASSCTINTDYFSEYRDVNLLDNYGFDAKEGDGVTAKWALATDPAFMTWEAVSDADRPNDAVYRLEIKNLVPNGDFEDATLTPDADPATLPTGWWTTYYDGSPPQQTAVLRIGSSPSPNTKVATIDGSRALGWDSAGAGNQLRVNLYGLVTGADPLAWKAIGYLFRVDLVDVGGSEQVEMSLYEGLTGNTKPSNQLYNLPDWTQKTDKDGTVFHVVRPFLLAADTEVRMVAFGSPSSTGNNAAVLDNIRLLPRSESLAVSTSLPKLSSGKKVLLPGSKVGMYVFSIDVRDDPRAKSGNHFAPTSFSVVLEAAVKSGSRNWLFTVTPPAEGWANWTTLKFRLGFDFVNSDADHRGEPALKISLSPTVSNVSDVDVGTVLVSRPVLMFNP